jgi:hypothetical protein
MPAITLRSGRRYLHLLAALWCVACLVVPSVLGRFRGFEIIVPIVGGMLATVWGVRRASLKVVLDTEHLTVRNMFRTARIPWKQVEAVGLLEIRTWVPRWPGTPAIAGVDIQVRGQWLELQALQAAPVMLNGIRVVADHPPRWLELAFREVDQTWAKATGRDPVDRTSLSLGPPTGPEWARWVT